jgi:hypothetical protein
VLGEPCSAEGLDCLCSMVTKLFTVSLCRESRHISSCQNFLFTLSVSDTTSVILFIPKQSANHVANRHGPQFEKHWLRELFTGLSPWRFGFTPRSVHMRFVVDKVALGLVFIQVCLFSAVSIIPMGLLTHISSWA